jgi:hypothetical protein
LAEGPRNPCVTQSLRLSSPRRADDRGDSRRAGPRRGCKVTWTLYMRSKRAGQLGLRRGRSPFSSCGWRRSEGAPRPDGGFAGPRGGCSSPQRQRRGASACKDGESRGIAGVGERCIGGEDAGRGEVGAREITPRIATTGGSVVSRADYAPPPASVAPFRGRRVRSGPGAAVAVDGDLDLADQKREDHG